MDSVDYGDDSFDDITDDLVDVHKSLATKTKS